MKNEITAKRLTLALSNANIRPQELADKSGVSKASISQYVNGSHAPSNISSGKMASVLNVNPLWLMGFDVPMTENEPQKPQPVAPPKIMTYYDQLNDFGKREATKRVQELTYFPQYSASEPMLNAAHADDYANTPDELKQLEEDMIDKAFRPN